MVTSSTLGVKEHDLIFMSLLLIIKTVGWIVTLVCSLPILYYDRHRQQQTEVSQRWKSLARAAISFAWFLWGLVGLLLVFAYQERGAIVASFSDLIPPTSGAGYDQRFVYITTTFLTAWVLSLMSLSSWCAQHVFPYFRLDASRGIHRMFVLMVIGEVLSYLCTWPGMGFLNTPGLIEGSDTIAIIFSLFLTGVSCLLFAFIGTGCFITRSWTETVVRVGLHRTPSWQGAGMAVFSTIFLYVTENIYYMIKPYFFEGEVFVFFISNLGVLFLFGVVPGFTEEILYRGILQPKIGIFATSVLFTLGHFRPDWVDLMHIFLASLIFGWLAKRCGLWISISTHALFNIVVAAFPLGRSIT